MDDVTFKKALAQWVAGVTIVTTHADGMYQGMTASSFTSVSLNPHLILISIGKKVSSYPLIEKSGVFAANILHTGQLEWARRFAGLIPDVANRFEGIDFTTAATGSPILPGVLAWVDCEVYRAYEAGDHTIFVGQVVAADGQTGGQPLLYHSRTWGHFAPLPVQE